MNYSEKEWNGSYKNKDNFLFYPNEEVVRFISKYIKKKIGYNEYIIKRDVSTCLDLGCGIGRHVLYLDELGLDVYGIDISEEAIKFANKYFDNLGKEYLRKKLTVGSINKLPYLDTFFDFAVSHGVLDSMYFDLAKEGINEIHRVLRDDGLLYIDLISGDDYNHFKEYEGEEVVSIAHEKGTIQSYFNWRKINLLLQSKFEILDCILVQRESIISPIKNSRYHIVAKKTNNM